MVNWLFGAAQRDAAVAYARDLSGPFFGAWTRATVARMRLRAGMRVLDVACGTGALAHAAAARVGARGRVVAMDASGVMLEVARDAMDRAAPVDDGAVVALARGDVHALPFADGSFDRVSCPHGLAFFRDPPSALREMHRMLSPGGRLVVTAWGRRERNPHESAMADAFARHLRVEPPFFATLFAFAEDGALERVAREAGLVARVERVRARAEFPDAASYWRGMSAGRPVFEILERLPAPVVARIRDDSLAGLAPYRRGEGFRAPVEALVLTVVRGA